MTQTPRADRGSDKACLSESHAETVKQRWFAKLAFALLLTGLLASSIVIATYFQFDGAMAMRAATDCVMPLGLVWLTTFLLAAFVFLLGKRHLAMALAAAWVVVGCIGNDWVAQMVIGPIEWPRDPAVLTDPTPFRCVITLGGSITIAKDGTPELGADGQRVMLAAQLWYAGKTDSIVCTGSSSDGLTDPSTACRTMLASIGVPTEILYEVKGHNTTEEMQSLEQFFLHPPAGFPVAGRIGVITSAFHIPRAMRLAEQRGLDFVPLPCSYRIGKSIRFKPSSIIPNSGSASTLATGCKEWLARLLGR